MERGYWCLPDGTPCADVPPIGVAELTVAAAVSKVSLKERDELDANMVAWISRRLNHSGMEMHNLFYPELSTELSYDDWFRIRGEADTKAGALAQLFNRMAERGAMLYFAW